MEGAGASILEYERDRLGRLRTCRHGARDHDREHGVESLAPVPSPGRSGDHKAMGATGPASCPGLDPGETEALGCKNDAWRHASGRRSATDHELSVVRGQVAAGLDRVARL